MRIIGIRRMKMKKRFTKLKEEYERLEQEYMQEVARNLDLEYKYNTLYSEYENDISQRKEIEELHENTRRLKHDMKNHIMVIASYLNNNEIESAKDYLSVVLDNLNKVYSYIHTGNEIMNYIINTKLLYASKNDIKFNVEIENLAFHRMRSVDFSSLLGNALDNAIEASMDLKEKFISIVIKKKRNYDTILIKNKIEKSVLDENPKLATSKDDKENHGIGLEQIKLLTEKYDGLLDIYEENEMFCVNIMIPS